MCLALLLGVANYLQCPDIIEQTLPPHQPKGYLVFFIVNIESSKPRSSQTEAIFHNLCFKIQTALSRLVPMFQRVVKVLHMIRLESCRNLTGCAYESSEPWPGQTYDDWWSISGKKNVKWFDPKLGMLYLLIRHLYLLMKGGDWFIESCLWIMKVSETPMLKWQCLLSLW